MPDEKLARLVELAARLRGPDGCPWDREQDYDSVKALLIEEAYEVVDAVNARDFAELREELGDLLFQVVFYSQLASEEGRFDIGNVIEDVHRKLVRRHPHVFGDVRAENSEQALKSWLSVKESEKQKKEGGKSNAPFPGSILEGIGPSLPSTLEAYELGTRASKAGFEWRRVEDLLDKVAEELEEVRRQISRNGSEGESMRPETSPPEPGPERRRTEEEVGDLLFAAANLARFLHFDPESALRAANRKFRRRFEFLEAEVARRGKKLQECSLEELDRIWDRVKAEEKR